MPKAEANGIQIEYETFGDPSGDAILLVMGLGMQLIAWGDEFCSQLAGSGLYVIRFDNRDVGLSSKIEEAGVPDIAGLIGKMMQGQPITVPYTLEDMADDAVGLLVALGIEKAHVCGASMGGMIAQYAAIRHPSRVRSLVSIYSTTGNPELPQPGREVLELLLTPAPAEREAFIEYNIELFRALAGPGCHYEENWVRELAGASYDRSFYPQGIARQVAAIMTQANRKPALASLKVPTLVVHGSADPLVPVEAGRDTAEAVPGAELLIVEGMGHDPIFGECWEKIGRAIIEHAGKA